jgi:dipeptidyl aminopeptidase/acylaminoacyl peptidase
VEWSKADGQIYFSATDGCNVSLFRLNPTTKKCEKFELPVTYLQGYSIALQQKNPAVVFFGQTGERSREMFIASLNSTNPKCKPIGEISFDELYKDVAIGTCHDWKFLSSRGDSINGFYFLPPNFDANKKYPLIVYYYGGCTPTTKALEFQYPLQVLAGQGYVVYVCEPSGAIGFGQEFAARHVNTWGKESGDDIIEGTKQFLKEHPFVNPDKVGCMGASYGGFMTQYLQTRTDIFAAAISHAGISNIASYWGGGYWGYTYGEIAQYGSYPWNNPDLYIKQSPLFNADKINTPILLLHGTVDTNVPTNESQQLFTALRILGKPVSYIQIDGENHVITNYNKRLAWQNAIFAWFAHWLKDQPEWWTELYPEERF